MENKQIKHSFQKGMTKDIAKSLLPNEFYFHGQNIRVMSTNAQSAGAITNEKGNSLVLNIPIPELDVVNNRIKYLSSVTNKTLTYKIDSTLSLYPRCELEENYYILDSETFKTSGAQFLIGNSLIRDNFILFSTDNKGFDCIWKVNDITFDLELLYMRNMGFNKLHPVQAINNYENKTIDKVYWVDSKSQMRFVNIYHSTLNQDIENLIDLNFNSINTIGTFDIKQPKILDVSFGGEHTSGMIQYAYNLYRINGSQSKLSPLSELVSLDNGDNNGGGEINEILSRSPLIEISELDKKYTNLKIYAVKYTSYNEIPKISLIFDENIVNRENIIYYDNGSIIQSLSLEEFIFLGSDLIIPKHINTKNNIMFLANYKEKNFDVNTKNDINSIDLRAFSFETNSSSTEVYNSLTEVSDLVVSLEPVLIIPSTVILLNYPLIDYKHSTINKNYDIFNKQHNSNVIGGEGYFLKYEIKRNHVGINGFLKKDSKGKFLKDNEIYRLGIQFYNEYGQYSLPKWIADFKNIVIDNFSNLNGYYSSVEITLKSEFYIWLNNNNNFLDEDGVFDSFLKPVGYKLLRAERNLSDKTIICQGLLNGMISQLNGDATTNQDEVDDAMIIRANKGVKLPSMMRRFDDFLCPMYGNKNYSRLDRQHPENHPTFESPMLGDNFLYPSAGNEVFKAPASGDWTQGSYQFNQLMQMFSPEIIFNSIQNLSKLNLEVLGAMVNNNNSSWVQVRNTETKTISNEIKVYNSISPWDEKSYLPENFEILSEPRTLIQNAGFFADARENEMNFVQTYREYNGEFKNSQTRLIYETYGSPEIVEKGQGRSVYNSDEELVYYNSLIPLSSDLVLNSVNSFGAKNITFALGNNSTLTKDRTTIEKLKNDINSISTDVGVIAEFRIPNNLIYIGNIYGGNSYESKKRTKYVEVGDYNSIYTSIYNCLHLGDTFTNNFKFTKLVKTDTEIYAQNSEQLTEIVNFRVETTVDLKNRNDLSINEWTNKFQPKYEDYQKYNKVYSQESNFIIRKDLDYKFKTVTGFDTNVIATKTKTPGEIIDSWTDIQPNTIITLDGKYGPINSLHNFKNQLYTLQDSAVAFLSIQPRIQINGSDGFEVELGSGKILQEYRYLSTDSGTKNKWSVISSPQTFYYFDIINKTINFVNENISGLTDQKGLHTFITNDLIVSDLLINNPIIKQGVVATYDYINNCVLFTFLQNKNATTLSYNESLQQFESFYDYIPSMYLSKGNMLLALNQFNNKLYKQYAGNYNQFFDIYYPSYVTLLVNPQIDYDTVLDNVKYKSELYLNNVDQYDKTLTHIQTYNEYQDSGLVPLISDRNGNLRRKFRDWNIILPRNKNTRQRIRNPWNYLKLQYEHSDNYQLILHNPVISFRA